MTTAKNIYDFINGFAPFETQMHFDNAGLLIGKKMLKLSSPTTLLYSTL